MNLSLLKKSERSILATIRLFTSTLFNTPDLEIDQNNQKYLFVFEDRKRSSQRLCKAMPAEIESKVFHLTDWILCARDGGRNTQMSMPLNSNLLEANIRLPELTTLTH